MDVRLEAPRQEAPRQETNNTYIIDARGADAGVEQRLIRAMNELAGPGRVERRAINAVWDHNARGKRFGGPTR